MFVARCDRQGRCQWQLSVEGGSEPLWAPDGQRVFYRSGNQVVEVEVATEPTLSPGRRRVLFEGAFRVDDLYFLGNYDISPDGERFVMAQTVAGPSERTAPALVVVRHWFEELQRLVPVN